MSKIVSLFNYPLKSGHKSTLQKATGDAFGFTGDRQFVILNKKDLSLYSLRDNLILCDVEVSYFSEKLSIKINLKKHVITCFFETKIQAKIWSKIVNLKVASSAVNQFFSELLNTEVYLAKLEPSQGQTLMDSGPIHLVSLSDMDRLRELCDLPNLDPMIFRPNIVIDNLSFMENEPPKKLAIGGYNFTVLERTERCNAVSILHRKQHNIKSSYLIPTLNELSEINTPYFGIYLQPEENFSIKTGDYVKIY